MTKKPDTAEEAGTVFLVDFLVVPNGDCDGVRFAEVEIVVLVPFWIQSIPGSVRGVSLSGSVNIDSDKRVRKTEEIPLGKISSTQDCYSYLDSTLPVTHPAEILSALQVRVLTKIIS